MLPSFDHAAYTGKKETTMSAVRVSGLRVEYKVNPLGLDIPKPRLFWLLEANGRGTRQHAYQVLVASSREILDNDEGDLWDSGRVESDQSIHVVYAGAPLKSRQCCYWKVRVWDGAGVCSLYSAPAFWSMGLLEKTDWTAQWIGFDVPPLVTPPNDPPMSFDGLLWMGFPEKDPTPPTPQRHVGFRGIWELPPDAEIVAARALLSAGSYFDLYIDGEWAGTDDGRPGACHRGSRLDLTGRLKPGRNTLAMHVRHRYGPCAIIGRLQVDLSNGQMLEHVIDGSWRCAESPPEGFVAPEFDDSGWLSTQPLIKELVEQFSLSGNGTLRIPAPSLLRREFSVDTPVAKATLYVTALGLYEFHLNGQRVGDDLLRPGWTDFHKRAAYQTYDVTTLIRPGQNAAGAMLGHGWYSGYMGWSYEPGTHYGKHPRLCAQLEIVYADGRSERITTDSDWLGSQSHILGADLYMGEICDLRREPRGWDRPGWEPRGWEPVICDAAPGLELNAYPGVPVRRITELKPREITSPAPGVYIFDIGQNMVGWARLRVRGGKAGATITLRFAEVLNPDGTIYVENLRGARSTDAVVLAGEELVEWEPAFTFHGFRYVEVTGYPGTPDLDAIMGVVVHSDMPLTGRFVCSDPVLNQLQHNIQWGQRGNFLEVPTDCPQRDERLGWTGDAQVFCRTASFNMETAAFFTKWLQDLTDGQSEVGGYPDVAPRVVCVGEAAPAWGDAGIIVPWTMLRCYGDTGIVERQWDSMRRWMDYQQGGCTGFVRTDRLNSGYADWLSIDAVTPQDLIATAFFAYDAALMAEMAEAIGHPAEAQEFRRLFENVRAAFVEKYVSPDGAIACETQTAYVLALQFNLLPAELRQTAADRLVEDIRRRDWHLSTGFVGCSYLPFALSGAGKLDVVYKLLDQKTFPSWCYAVVHGATTIWERWDGWTEERGFQDPGMNSFNHYAYGAVGEWMYRAMAGIDVDAGGAGYKHTVFRPQPGGGITHACAEYRSLHGMVKSAWRIEEGRFFLEIMVPPNTTGEVILPTRRPDDVTESDTPLSQAEGVSAVQIAPEGVRFLVESGKYAFQMACSA